MSLIGNLAPSQAETGVLADIHDRAAAADRGEATLGVDLAALYGAGILAAVVTHTGAGGDTRVGARLLRRIGRASLSVGRLVEGHANALRLIQVYGTSDQQSDDRSIAAQGGIFGVWGADGHEPVIFTETDGNSGVMEGAKMFCSGLGILTIAVVPVNTDEGPLLVVARVDEADRADASGWDVSGMKSTASGRYDLTRVAADVLGRPGDYLREPHFNGGIWRYCALHCGGLEALAETVRQHLLVRAQATRPPQADRLARLALHANTVRLWVDASSAAVEQAAGTGVGAASAVTQALLAREAIEAACLEGIALSERAMGTAAFAASGDADRIRRDLAFFLRQADLDGKLALASGSLLADPAPVGEMW